MSPGNLPLIAIVGRPNVGKSTLFNRIVGGRPALVSKEPGMTRDRHIETGEWTGRYFRVVDTGGLQSEKSFLTSRITDQVQKAIEEANLIFFVVDGRTGFTAQDEEIAALLRRSGRPVLLLVNKMDSPKNWHDSMEFHRFGFEKVIAISAEHGFGVDEALDYAVDFLQLPVSMPLLE
ncbi:MAG TPA: GTP-binding protein, partial [Acidobacteriota bacterium]